MKFNRLFAKTWLALLCLFLTKSSTSQYFSYDGRYREPDVVLEIGALGGVMNAFTEVGGNTKTNKRYIQHVTFSNTKLLGGFYIAGTYNDHFSGRLQYSFGQLEGADSLTADPKSGRAVRNLSYRTSIQELSLMFEWHPDMLWRNRDLPPAMLSPYLLCGIGYLRFDPTTKYGDDWVRLRPLRLEGQGFAEYPDREMYKAHAISFPLGAGLRYELGPHFYVRGEAALHFTTTDYLDDVSHSKYVDPTLFYKYLPQKQADLATQLYSRIDSDNLEYRPETNAIRGNPNMKDLFWTVSLHVGIVLNREKL